FQLFLSLLDSDRFYGKFRDGAHKVDVSDLMRRMVKEDLLTFQGTKLFPERRAITANYTLSDLEEALYAAVTEYVRTEMNRADRIEDGRRRGNVGFALTALQRRLASSPEAIYQSLKRRRNRLIRQLEEAKLLRRGSIVAETCAPYMAEDVDDPDDLNAEQTEELEEKLVDLATAAETIAELEAEIQTLTRLEAQACEVVHSEQDRKWEELSNLLQNTPEMHDREGRQRKLIIFTEHRDTLNYLTVKIGGLLGDAKAVINIHGGTKREDRRKAQELFRNDPDIRILVATDAAGEGVNLQNANLMVNYDLPWNPNRIEQRFGRIHRIGQTEVCFLWNLVANQTREGDVFQRLFEKLEVERKALGGRVFDILGDVFNEKSLRELLIEAIRYGEDPARKQALLNKVDGALDSEHLRNIISNNALCEEVMDEQRLFAVKAAMEKAEARKLQPYFVRAFFEEAFRHLGGELKPRETGRWSISHVPAIIRERDRQISGRDRRFLAPVVTKYDRVCFEKKNVRLLDRVGAPPAELLHPAHPLMQAMVDLVLEQHRTKLKQGTVFLDPNDTGTTPRLLFIIEHAVREGADPSRTVSQRMQFVEILPDGRAVNAGYGPHLDLEPLSDADRRLIEDLLDQPWIKRDLEQQALAFTSEKLVPEHFTEVRDRREHQIDKTMTAVKERLVKEINFWSTRQISLEEDIAAGKEVRLQLDNVKRTIEELTSRLQSREQDLAKQRHVISATPVVIGGALIIPAGLLVTRQGQTTPTTETGNTPDQPDALDRQTVEKIAMNAVIQAELAMGHQVIDVSAEKCGWDVTSIPPARDGRLPTVRHIEVKGRAKGADTITVTRNEVLYGFNQGDKFMLAIVLVGPDQSADGPYYLSRPFDREPGWAETSINFDLAQLLTRAQKPLLVAQTTP
ncbi:MAG TPA: helicase-related protein, partial [Candidatus Ozemobacteraceae bacterium]|nr:helicase-related protein [Candidatus Ozemobacteraceae bacterium]